MSKRNAVLTCLLVFVLLIRLLTAGTAYADPVTYPVWLGSTQVTGSNMTDILGDGKASFIPSTNTLTLNSPGITGLKNNSLIYSEGIDLTIKGSASLNGGTGAIQVQGGSVYLEGNITASGSDYGVFCGKEIHVQSGTITANGSIGLYGLGGVYVSGGTVNASGSTAGIDSNKGITISGGKVTAKGTGSEGVGIKAISAISFGNGLASVDAYGTYSAVSGSSISIGDDLMIKTPAGGATGTSGGNAVIMQGSTVATTAEIVHKEALPRVIGIRLHADGTKLDGGVYCLNTDVLSFVVEDDKSTDVKISISPLYTDAACSHMLDVKPSAGTDYFFMVEMTSGSDETGGPNVEWVEAQIKTSSDISAENAAIAWQEFAHSPKGAALTTIYKYTEDTTRYLCLGTTAGGTYDAKLGETNIHEDVSGTLNMAGQAGETAVLTAKPATGYTFSGWYEGVRGASGYVESNNGILVSSDSSYTFNLENNTNLQAVFEKGCTVTFDSRGGTPVASQTVPVGGKAVKPEDPTRSGLDFGGWYKDEANTEPYDFNSSVTGDMTLYASWKQYIYSITGVKVWKDNDNADGKRPASVDVRVLGNGELISTLTLTESGGWKKMLIISSGTPGLVLSCEEVVPEGYVLEGITDKDGTFILTNRLAASCTVTFDNNGHGTAPAAQTVDEGKTAAKPADPTETGWSFGGWYTEAGCTNPFDFSTPITSSLTVYAKWTEETATAVTYAFTKGSGAVWQKGSTAGLDFTVKGFPDDTDTFANFTGIRVDGAAVSTASYSAAAGSVELTLYPEYLQTLASGGHIIRAEFKDEGFAEGRFTVEEKTGEIKTFTVSFYGNGGTGTMASVTVNAGATYFLPENGFTAPDGKTFAGWDKGQPGGSLVITEDTTVTAQWKDIQKTNYSNTLGNLDLPPLHVQPEIPVEDRYDFRFTFTKKWAAEPLKSIDWVMYNPDGTVAHKKFNKKIISDTEWRYEAWFTSSADYYIIENVPEGYKVRYENVGIHAGVTDRCYNGGAIINYKVPKTGDTANLRLWAGMVLFGLGIAFGTAVFSRRKNRKQETD